MPTTDESVTHKVSALTGRERHRRETRNQIVFPFLLAVIFIVLIVLIAAFLNNPAARTQVTAIADFMLSTMILCPAVICLFPVYLLVVVAIYGANKLHDGTQKPLERIEGLISKYGERVTHWTDRTNENVSEWSARLEPLMQVMSVFNEPTTKKTEEPEKDVSKPE